MVNRVIDASIVPNIHGNDMSHLKIDIDCYCGSGLFCLTAAAKFDICVGIEVNERAIEEAKVNAHLNHPFRLILLLHFLYSFSSISLNVMESVIVCSCISL